MRARALKWPLWVVIAGVVLFLLLGWLAGREWTLQYALDELASRTNGDVKVVGGRGGLYEGLTFDRLEIRQPNQLIVLEQGVILWEPVMFLSKTFHVREANIARATITILKKSNEPAREPESLELPIDLNVPLAKVGVLEIVDGGNTTRLSAIELGVQYVSRHWQIERASVATPWGTAKVALGLDATRPFALKGDVAFVQERGETPFRVAATLAGKLADVTAAGNFSVKNAKGGGDISGSASAQLAPFKPLPLVRAG